MTNSKVKLGIQEIAEARGLDLEELSQVSQISLDTIRQKYTSHSVELKDEVYSDLRKIAEKLDVPVIELIKPVAKKGGFKLKIIDLLKTKDLTIEELSEQSKVHPALLAFYGTQSIDKQKLAEPIHKKNLNKISEVFGCGVEDLKVASPLATTMFRHNAITEEKGLSLEDLAKLTDFPHELIDLISTQPWDMDSLSPHKIPYLIYPGECLICCAFGLNCCQNCRR